MRVSRGGKKGGKHITSVRSRVFQLVRVCRRKKVARGVPRFVIGEKLCPRWVMLEWIMWERCVCTWVLRFVVFFKRHHNAFCTSSLLLLLMALMMAVKRWKGYFRNLTLNFADFSLNFVVRPIGAVSVHQLGNWLSGFECPADGAVSQRCHCRSYCPQDYLRCSMVGTAWVSGDWQQE